MKLNPQDLEKIASLTLDHYNERAEEFWQGTRDHDVKQNIAALSQWTRNTRRWIEAFRRDVCPRSDLELGTSPP